MARKGGRRRVRNKPQKNGAAFIAVGMAAAAWVPNKTSGRHAMYRVVQEDFTLRTLLYDV